MARRRKSPIPGLSYSWKRATGVTRAKQRFARKTGIPTSRAGLERKVGRMTTGGCLTLAVTALAAVALAVCAGALIFL